MYKRIAVVGIHTGIGKTLVSAVLSEATGYDYWKPVQAGVDERDMVLVRSLITNGLERVHAEQHLLQQPLSPHTAAAIDGVAIDIATFAWPQTDRGLIVETAGGLLSPMNDTATMADFIEHYDLPVVLVTQNYLGSINHTLTALEVMKVRGLKLLGMIVSGAENASSESFITNYTGVPISARIPRFAAINTITVAQAAAAMRPAVEQMLAR